MALTIHAADELRHSWDDSDPTGDPVKGGAVAVEGDRVAATGSLAELRERFPGARVRSWPGVLGPGLVHRGPVPDAPTPRERVHALLKSGAVAVLAEYVDTAELRAAAERTDVVVSAGAAPPVIRPTGRADLAVFGEDGVCLATVCGGRLVHRRR
ncbi:imidazolonepropionase-like domain-containing protein [Streptomyces sp. NPDC017991]|uniref:imidazolonepropionase-like domain-containing protein n=1 Tax=Streptomyces sp. NPDC017991 TaxID=3365026 RepID=UPI00379D71CC